MSLQALIFEPILKRRIWGGRRLSQLGKTLPPDEPIGESWELADLEEDQSIVRAGPMRGKTLRSLMDEWGADLLGDAKPFEGRFPLLIKYLDAAQTLSVQVHPDREMAERLGGSVRVKNEAWYVIDAEADAVIYRGVNPGVDKDAFIRAIDQGEVAETLRQIPARINECHYLPSGTIHALGAGILVAEVQTPSDTTYRVYDWDRVDSATGKPRELHIDKALQCIDFGASPPDQPRSHVASVWTQVSRLTTCDDFIIERVRMTEGLDQEIPYGGLVVWMVLEGQGRISYEGGGDPLTFETGDTVLLPAAMRGARLLVQKDCCWLEVTIPQASDLADFPRPSADELRAAPDGLVQLKRPDAKP